MNDSFSRDDVLFDRLVDDELSAAERRELLASLDARPQGWRHCALAFLEAQSWKKDLREIAATAVAPVATEKFIAPKSTGPRTAVRAIVQWLAVAAAVIVAFRIGALQTRSGLLTAGDAVPTVGQVASVPPSGRAPGDAKPADALNLWVRNDAGQMQRVRVPLVDASQLDDELGVKFLTGVPDDVRSRLQNQGYSVQSKRRYAPLWLDNGRPMIVPVEDTRIVPDSNKVY
jgi:hypothetical protein